MSKSDHTPSKWESRLAYALFLFLVFEITVRIFHLVTYGTPFFRQDKLVYRFYPEVKAPLEQGTEVGGDTLSMVVLGGSAVNVKFCNLDSLFSVMEVPEIQKRPVKVFQLAQYAQNTLDSWNKYELLKDHPFDYVFFYHGINDTRTNNAPPEVFDEDYRHISFYNDYYLLRRHPEINFTTLPYLGDVLFQKVLEGLKLSPKIPKEYNIMEYFREKKILDRTWWEHGKDIKSQQTYRRNLTRILELAKKKGDRPMLLTYASYLPENYHIDLFSSEQLDYNFTPLKSWPVEIYGEPEFVSQGIDVHNAILREIARKRGDQVSFVDFAFFLPKEKEYFYDICHLTPKDAFMSAAILRQLDFYQENN